MAFHEILQAPGRVLIQDDEGWSTAHPGEDGCWQAGNVLVTAAPHAAGLRISLSARSAVHRVALVWHRSTQSGDRLLGDHWERGYGDLEWRGVVPERVMPWYFLLHNTQGTHGFGVQTGPAALCFWQVSGESLVLCLDTRCGGSGVLLGGAQLELANVICRPGKPDEMPFAAARAFLKLLCPNPVLPAQPVYGGNNWYYAYGKSSHQEILADSAFVASLAPQGDNRPFMVIDDGWELNRDTAEASLWRMGNGQFPDMGALAREMKALGVRPGIWVRPLSAPNLATESLCLPPNRFLNPEPGRYLDPSIPEVLDIVATDIAQQVQWGYEMIKHDFTTFDLLGRWGFQMGGDVTHEGWHFADRSKTSAQIIGQLYRTIGRAAGDALIIGCNTISHIGAGVFHLQRTGDDTSGRQWERTRKMGVNTLAFRMAQHGAMYACDADCAGITAAVPWEQNRQWLDLLSRSGTPLFVSASPAVAPEQREAIRAAFAHAATEIAPAEPLDWMETTCPAHWVLDGENVEFHWNREDAVEFLRP